MLRGCLEAGLKRGKTSVAESIFGRVRRVIAGSVEDAVDAMERAGGTGVMREAIREVDRVLDEVRGEHEAAAARRLQAMRQARMFREQAAALEEKAQFALTGNREDLAEAAIARQIDFEAHAERLDAAQSESAEQAERLEACLAALKARKEQMEEELAVWEANRREAMAGGDTAAPRRKAGVERRVAQAEAAFGRILKDVNGAGLPRADARAAAGVAEIELLQRSAAIAQRMEALRAARAEG